MPPSSALKSVLSTVLKQLVNFKSKKMAAKLILALVVAIVVVAQCNSQPHKNILVIKKTNPLGSSLLKFSKKSLEIFLYSKKSQIEVLLSDAQGFQF